MPVIVTPLTPTQPSGALLVTFTDINPPVRNDGVPWTTVQISEAGSLDGPWAVIDTQLILPADTDPSAPQARTFTTRNATIQNGFYTLTFVDRNGGASRPIEQIQDVPSEIRPSLSDLGSFMRARTVVEGSAGNEAGTFTSATRPTDTQAHALIDQAVQYVLMDVGQQIPDRLILQARFLALVYAAQLIELTFYRNEVNRDQSAYQQYVALYQQGVQALKRAVDDTTPAGVQAGFFSVPVLTRSQARFQAFADATNPDTGIIDPSKLSPEWWYPRGPGGIPPWMQKIWPWFGGDAPAASATDWDIVDLESQE